jgi:hypothetical protein
LCPRPKTKSAATLALSVAGKFGVPNQLSEKECRAKPF